ncbi:MAG: NADH-quinone oxidoreductase subunit B family protein [Coriobacteriia bacterium]|nr:NADH-quinone oxidoreductase subunit B family protein [Coriobacteriia bacterium]
MALVDDLGKALDRSPGGSIILTSVDAILDWSRGKSLWTMPMGTACCAMELIAASFSKFDFDRHGTIPRPDPRHTDVMVVAGTITHKMAPAVKLLYAQMPEPKWVIAMGNCAISGGIFYYDTYSVVRGVDEFLPVDVYIAGCPPRPEALQDAIFQLRKKVAGESIASGRERKVEYLLPRPEDPRKGDLAAEAEDGEDR